MKSTRALKSQTSLKSTKSTKADKRSDMVEMTDFCVLLPSVCMKLQCPYSVRVKKEQYRDTPRQPRRLSLFPPQTTAVSEPTGPKTSDRSKSGGTETLSEDNAISIIAVYDTYNCLTEIVLNEIKVPRILIQVIALLIPYYHNLTTITVRRCQIDFYTIHEICNILEQSSITTVCFDNSPVIQRTYEALLYEKSNLRSLSLCKCKLDDDDCKQLAAKLHLGAPADNLQILNLSSNQITDVGAKYISDALRTNRHLRYLCLADNWVNDEGAGYLFAILVEFPLTDDEIKDMRLRYMKYLKCKQIIYAKHLNPSFDELSQVSRKSAKKRKTTRKETDSNRKYSDDDVKVRAELLANEIMGEFTDPFDSKSIKHRDNNYYCVGNMVLCYLNLAYNNLSLLSINKLLSVVMYQEMTKRMNQCGLIKVVIEGNNLPMCREIELLNELLSRYIKAGRPDARRRPTLIRRP